MNWQRKVEEKLFVQKKMPTFAQNNVDMETTPQTNLDEVVIQNADQKVERRFIPRDRLSGYLSEVSMEDIPWASMGLIYPHAPSDLVYVVISPSLLDKSARFLPLLLVLGGILDDFCDFLPRLLVFL